MRTDLRHLKETIDQLEKTLKYLKSLRYYEDNCLECNEIMPVREWSGKRMNKKYCSKLCRSRAYERRKRESNPAKNKKQKSS